MITITDNSNTHQLLPIKQFREQHNLPDSFGVAQFEPKDFTGMGAIDKAGSALNELHDALIDAVPETLIVPELFSTVDALRKLFRSGLYGINDDIGLKLEEVEFAVSGFADVLMAWAYALIQQRGKKADFSSVYQQWLIDSVRVSQHIYSYDHNGTTWQIQMVNYAYGRLGLRIEADTVTYVQDRVYACPAHGYMQTLLRDLSTSLQMSHQSAL